MTLPAGWEKVRLDEVADVQLGRQRSPKNHLGERMRPYVRAANLTWSGLNLADLKEMNFSEAESEKFELRPGDVLVAEASGSQDEVGKPAVWRGEIDGCCFQNTVVRVRTQGPLPEYLRYFLLGEARSGRIGRASPGVGIHHIGAGRLSAWLVPVPPLAEQRRIVAAIEEQFSRLGAADAALEACCRKIDAFVARVRREAVAWRDGWSTLPFDEAFEPVSDEGRKVKHRDYATSGEIPVVDQGELSVGGYTDNDALRYRGPLPVIAFGDHTRRFKLVAQPFAVGADGVKLIAPRSGWVPRFAHLALEAVELPDRGYSRHYQFLRKAVVHRPSLAIQDRIVTLLDDQLSAVDRLRSSVEVSWRRSRLLRRAILERAFRGELVGQDPNDEPASVLLQRIRAERAAAPNPWRRMRVTV